MKWEDIIQQLLETIKAPETLEEAIDFIQNDPSCQAVVEDMAYKQVVLNILVAAGIVSEKDFNDSIAHFKSAITRGFAEKLLQNLNGIIDNSNGIWVNVNENPPQNSNDEDWPEDDDPNIGKA